LRLSSLESDRRKSVLHPPVRHFRNMGKTARAVVAGATGYSGRELIRMLLQHPHLELVGAYASRTAEAQPLAEAPLASLQPEVIFLATPNEFSHEVVPALLETGATIVDVSGAYRLKDAGLYPKYYGFEHTRPDLLERAVFGLTEFVRAQLPGAKLIANPGCYVTSVLVPLAPLVKAGLLDSSQPLICDSKSGVTGAGKTPTATTHFVEVSESLKSYNLFKHRHTPEIAQGLGVENSPAALIFTPHLLPINRGILSTMYAKLKPGVTRADLLRTWQTVFADAPFVRIFDGAQLPEIKFAANTPFCDIGCVVDEASQQAILVSAEDNLLKGAASQALQNANLALGFDEKAGML
jgi:N-acetyl-gamma-glutamyl-phosphate reductase